jgi:hypothetical protein
MLWNVIEERRGEIADNQRGNECDDEKHADLPSRRDAESCDLVCGDRHIFMRLLRF